jgi:hypothetical protein
MDCQLTFKKAYGLTALTPEECCWLLELQSATFQVKSDAKLFHVSVGQMGENEQEKLAIMPFLHSDERRPEFINPIPTLNLTTELRLEIPASIYASWRTSSVADTIVEPFIDSAFTAYQNFAEAYRDTKYLTERGTPRWHDQRGFFVRLPSLNDFKTYLFYVLNAPDTTFVGSFSTGRILSFQSTDFALQQCIQETLNTEVPLSRLLMVNAWESLFAGDFRSSVISAATALELIVSELVTADWKRRKFSSTKIKEHLKTTDNSSLAAEVLELFNLSDSPRKKQSADLFKIRNELVHRRRRNASYDNATSAVETTEAFLRLAKKGLP